MKTVNSEQIVSKNQIVWLNGVDDKTINEALDLLAELLLEQRRQQIMSLTGFVRHDKVAADEGG